MGRLRDAAGRATQAVRKQLRGRPSAASRAWQAADCAARVAVEAGHPGLSTVAGLAAGAVVLATAAYSPQEAPDAMDAQPYATFAPDTSRRSKR